MAKRGEFEPGMELVKRASRWRSSNEPDRRGRRRLPAPRHGVRDGRRLRERARGAHQRARPLRDLRRARARGGLRGLHGLRPARARRVAAGARAQQGADRRRTRATASERSPTGCIGFIRGMRGELGPARRLLLAGLENARRLDIFSMQVDCAASLALVADFDGDPTDALERCSLRARALGAERGPSLRRLGPAASRHRCSRGTGMRDEAHACAEALTRVATSSGHARRARGARPRARRDGAAGRRARAGRRAARPRGRAAPGRCGSRPSGSRSSPSRGRAGGRRRARARDRAPGRGLPPGAQAGRAPARRPGGGGDRGPRRVGRAAARRAPPPTARERAVPARAGGRPPGRRRPDQQRDRGRALPQPAHGRHARAQHPRQARLPLPRRGQHQGRRGRAAGLARGRGSRADYRPAGVRLAPSRPHARVPAAARGGHRERHRRLLLRGRAQRHPRAGGRGRAARWSSRGSTCSTSARWRRAAVRRSPPTRRRRGSCQPSRGSPSARGCRSSPTRSRRRWPRRALDAGAAGDQRHLGGGARSCSRPSRQRGAATSSCTSRARRASTARAALRRRGRPPQGVVRRADRGAPSRPGVAEERSRSTRGSTSTSPSDDDLEILRRLGELRRSAARCSSPSRARTSSARSSRARGRGGCPRRARVRRPRRRRRWRSREGAEVLRLHDPRRSTRCGSRPRSPAVSMAAERHDADRRRAGSALLEPGRDRRAAGRESLEPGAGGRDRRDARPARAPSCAAALRAAGIDGALLAPARGARGGRGTAT